MLHCAILSRETSIHQQNKNCSQWLLRYDLRGQFLSKQGFLVTFRVHVCVVWGFHMLRVSLCCLWSFFFNFLSVCQVVCMLIFGTCLWMYFLRFISFYKCTLCYFFDVSVFANKSRKRFNLCSYFSATSELTSFCNGRKLCNKWLYWQETLKCIRWWLPSAPQKKMSRLQRR